MDDDREEIESLILEEMGMPYEVLIVDGISAVIYLLALFLLIFSCFKLYKSGSVPGVKLIILSVIFSVVVSTTHEVLYEEISSFSDSIFELTLSILYAAGIYGFFSMASHFSKEQC